MKLSKTFFLYLASVLNFGFFQSCFAVANIASESEKDLLVEEDLVEETDSISIINGGIAERVANITKSISMMKYDAVSFSGAISIRGSVVDIASTDEEALDLRIKDHPGSSTFFNNGTSFSSKIRGEGFAKFDVESSYGSFGVNFAANPFESELKLGLSNAFVGFRSTNEDNRIAIAFEAGRQKMSDVVFSPVQYDSIFDGVLIKSSIESEGGFGAKLGIGAFLIDASNFHFGEFSDITVGNKSYYINYSLINWKLFSGEYKDSDKVVIIPIEDGVVVERLEEIEPVNVSYAYTNSQLSVGINFQEAILGTDFSAYVGALMNHSGIYNASEHANNKGFFAGICIGNNSDYASLLLQFFYIEPVAVKETDYAGSAAFSNSLRSEITFADSGNPFLSQTNVMGPRAVIGVFPIDNVKLKLDLSYVMPIIGNLPNKTRAAMELSYSF